VEAALREGMSCIAIEREASYLPLIVARCRRPINLTFDFEGDTA
jgi:site-specific DNA-methyltransferase (adenine-specific)